MTLPSFPTLTSLPAAEHPDLVAAPVAEALAVWAGAAEVAVVEIDPDLADTAAMSEAYDIPLTASGNCVVVAGARAGDERIAACVVRADTRADVNTLVRKLLDVRKCSFLPMDRAVEETRMAYGGITPVGLPAPWRVLVHDALLDEEVVVLGSGVRRSKLLVPGRLLADLPGAEVVPGLGR
ncbi:prolyl-tRNA editing enzyme YbaK/EbsC (Cys-tRNA(Pro) deacylase) [Nocardioides cavernae]|uniref:Prolyl-tRNA editing enzyme YbaK/EbsC (Cys-tRNA(Pro) deacylase) n=1 Tax=Nocardioides cavernae TaxID=1921566 RepID=A0A7Y9H4X8_9ACTN|nr:YbaK/EbsC family protein [Nocardioides cavernae]NYE37299.1 prolyl-tRNA editing enzyme YbaK/EbsC (Cys-tRNA(Pro) deacylase) [Nocardioides cavernae]